MTIRNIWIYLCVLIEISTLRKSIDVYTYNTQTASEVWFFVAPIIGINFRNCSVEILLFIYFLLLYQSSKGNMLSSLQEWKFAICHDCLIKITFLHQVIEWGEHMPQHTLVSQRMTCRSWLSPSAMWVPRIELWSSGLVANTCLHWAISLAPRVLLGGLCRRRIAFSWPLLGTKLWISSQVLLFNKISVSLKQEMGYHSVDLECPQSPVC